MSEPTDPRLVQVVDDAIGDYLETTPVLKLSRRVMTIDIADAVWAWLAEGDEHPRSSHG